MNQMNQITHLEIRWLVVQEEGTLCPATLASRAAAGYPGGFMPNEVQSILSNVPHSLNVAAVSVRAVGTAEAPIISHDDLCRLCRIIDPDAAWLRVDERWKFVYLFPDSSVPSRALTESGMYMMLLRTTNNRTCEVFQDWVMRELKAAVRRQSGSSLPPPPATLAEQTDHLKTLERLLRGPGGELDPRYALALRDQAANYLTGATVVKNPDEVHVTLSERARQLGYPSHNNTHMSQIGRILAAKYRARYKEEPPRHEQYVDGGNRFPFTYFGKDLDIIDEAIHSYFRLKGINPRVAANKQLN